MLSHRTKRAVRGALSVAAVTALVTLSPGPALAQPPVDDNPPSTASEALERFRELSKRASLVNEDLLEAKSNLITKKKQEQKALADLKEARRQQQQASAREKQFRGQVDELASASLRGARFNRLSALFTGTSPEDFLDRIAVLDVLAADSSRLLDKYGQAVDRAAAAERKAKKAKSSASEARATQQRLVERIEAKHDDLNRQKVEVKKAYERLNAQEEAELAAGDGGGGDNGGGGGDYVPPSPVPGAAGVAVQTALAQRGDAYVWGAAGPDAFDCSGLTMFAYARAGISLPHSSRMQYGIGTPVAYGAWQPGDLLFYGSSASTIHHVAMYVGNGTLVHASTSGVPVLTASAPGGGGSDYLGAKRIV